MKLNKVIEIQQLNTGYRSSSSEHIVSQALELEARSGEFVMLMGPNGSGKSTLMQTIAGLLPPLSGKVLIQGQSLEYIKHRERAKLMSLVLTERIEHSNLTVWDIVTTGRYPYLGLRGRLRAVDTEVLEHCLECCRVAEMKHRYFVELSDGEKQRVLIARALSQETPLMLLDEPTAHLDLPSRIEVLTMLRGLTREFNKCIIVSTHELDLALQWADAIWLFDRTKGVESASPEDLVLSGSIERAFGSEQLLFDGQTGKFSLRIHNEQVICLSAYGMEALWLSHALQRMGYTPLETDKADKATPLIQRENNSWKLCLEEQEYIVPTLYCLQRLLTLHYPPKI